MDQKFMDQLEQWHQDDQFDKIIAAIEALPREEWGYELTGLLARACQNAANGRERPELHQRALELLASAPDEADPNWHFRMGFGLYWLGREPEAIPHFQRALALIGRDPETPVSRDDCRELLEACEEAVRLRALNDRYPAEALKDPAKALEYLRDVALHNRLGTPDEVVDGHLYLPEWQVTLTPAVNQLTGQSAVLHFHLSAPQWGRELFECSVGMGGDVKQAIGMAAGSFVFSFLQGVGRMERQEEPRLLSTAFAGKPHRWKAYLSDIVGMGASPKATDTALYWDALEEELSKRLGNQKLCFVKVYGAKVNGQVTGECRIDDIKSEKLSAKVAELVEQWDAADFASQKQFFFLRQEEDTLLPWPYAGAEGQAALKEKVIQAARLFHACKSDEDYDLLEERIAQATGDPVLAAECFAFLPEICSENAYCDKVTFPEAVLIQQGDGPVQTVYKNQIADYWPLHNALFSAFDEGVFGDQTNDIYRQYVSYSASAKSLWQAMQKGGELKSGKLSSVLYQMGDGFALR